MIPYSRQKISEKDIAAVVEVLKSEHLTQGTKVKEFEKAIANYCSAPFALATCNATAALHLACLALGVDSRSTVWVAANSFVATVNCARYCNAKVDFVDVDQKTGLLSVAALAEKLEQADGQGTLPNVLIVVHIAGLSCDMESISVLCKARGIAIIEDACHALGGSYQGKQIGNCRYSDCSVFSFHPVKPLTTGEGGLLISQNETLIENARIHCQHGIERRSSHFLDKGIKPDWYYEQQVLGYNFRLSDIQAALGLSQLALLDERIATRRKLAKLYFEKFDTLQIGLPDEVCYSESSWHLFPLRFPSEEQRDIACCKLRESGYAVNIHYLPLPNHPYYQALGFKASDYPGAEAWGKTELSIPLHDFVTQSMQAEVITLCEGVINSSRGSCDNLSIIAG